jgi:hypothetical protein
VTADKILAVHHYKRGIADYFNLGDFDKSIADNDQAPASIQIRGCAGQPRRVPCPQSNIDRAMQDYDQAIRLDARDPDRVL